MAAIEPAGDDGGDEELGAVAVLQSVLARLWVRKGYIRVGTSVGHREETGASVLQGEVLVGELLTVDGLATSALWGVSNRRIPEG